jgi:hypothetical protein
MRSMFFAAATLTAVFSCALLPSAIQASVTPEEADHLGKDLTAIGAEKAGNADGSVPAIEEADKPLAGWALDKSRRRYYRFKDEKPLFSIDASNVEQHAGRLTEAQVVALKNVAGYRMDVYPSHRACGVDPVYAERSKQNALEARLGADGWSLAHARTAGAPFPIPKNGVEALYNAQIRPQGLGFQVEGGTTTISPEPGSTEFTRYVWDEVMYWPSLRPEKASTESDGGVLFHIYYTFFEPAALRGQAVVATNYLNKSAEQYSYFPGQRRVRRLPNSEFDAAIAGFENQYLYDEQLLLWSTLDRYDYTLTGKQELYIPYNDFGMYDLDASPKEVYGKSFVNPSYRRYERHRVWVVDAVLKKGLRHLSPHRVYYLDEDSWSIVAVTEFNQKGKVWKLLESAVIPVWELGGNCAYTAFVIWDLLGGRYVADYSPVGASKDFHFIAPGDAAAGTPRFKSDFYTPDTLRALSDR